MSMSSLVSAAQSAVEMSALAATAAEDAMAAAKLANVHAKAALAAAELALELENKMKSEKGDKNEQEHHSFESKHRNYAPVSVDDLNSMHTVQRPYIRYGKNGSYAFNWGKSIFFCKEGREEQKRKSFWKIR